MLKIRQLYAQRLEKMTKTQHEMPAWFKFYPKDWLTSYNVMSMSCLEKGVYIDLLAIAWVNDGIPNDQAKAKQMLKLPLQEWEKCAWILDKLFYDDGTKYRNKRQELERESYQEKVYKLRLAGSLGGKKSPKKDDKKSAQANAKQKLPIQNQNQSNESLHDSCSEPDETPVPNLSPTKRIKFDKDSLKLTGIIDEDIKRWEKTYPACDILQQIKEMEEWIISNPIKTKKNYYRFCSGWLSKTQERGGSFSKTNHLLPEPKEAISFAINSLKQFGSMNYTEIEKEIDRFIEYYESTGLGKTSWQQKLSYWEVGK